jgi:hypothetical protein
MSGPRSLPRHGGLLARAQNVDGSRPSGNERRRREFPHPGAGRRKVFGVKPNRDAPAGRERC